MADLAKANFLRNIKSSRKCPVVWTQMKGSERVRQCTQCGLNNYDLADLTETAVNELISTHDRNPSKALYRRPDGKYMIRDCPSSVWRNLCGPSSEEVWHRIATEINARFLEGDFWNGCKVELDHENWIITLDTFVVNTGKTSTTFTRMRAPFVNSDGFRFEVYRKSCLDDFAKFFGMQDIEIGDEEFDDKFIIKANDAQKVKSLLSARLRQLILEQREFFGIYAKDDEGWLGIKFPANVDELYFSALGTITDLVVLRQLFAIFAETLDQLRKIGSAANLAPDIKL